MKNLPWSLLIFSGIFSIYLPAQSTYLSETIYKNEIKILNKPTDLIPLANGWEERDTLIPSPRYYAGSAVYMRNDTVWLYVFGGDSTGNGTPTKTCSRYNLNSNRWELIAEMPAPLRLNGAANLGDKLYTFGGFATGPYDSTGEAAKPVSFLFEYDVNSNRWIQLPDLDSAFYFLRGIGYQDSLLYILGGGSSALPAHNDVTLLNIPLGSRVKAAGLLYSTGDGGAALADSGMERNIYYIGGYLNRTTASDRTLKGRIDPLDHTLIQWTYTAIYPGGGRGRINAHEWGADQIIAAGGSKSSGFDADSLVHIFNAEKGTYQDTEIKLPVSLTAYQSGTVITNTPDGVIKRFLITGGVTQNSTISNRTFVYSDTIPLTGVESDLLSGKKFTVHRNFPNPFNPYTTIFYSLSEDSGVEVRIFDILGKELKILVKEFQKAGEKETLWDGTDEYGNEVSSGVYIYKISGRGLSVTGKMVLIR